MIKINSNLLSYIPKSLILDNPPYFIDSKINTKEDIFLDNKKITDVITERISPFGTHSTLISLTRSNRPQMTLNVNKISRQESCLFDNLDKVAKPQKQLKGVYIAPNPFSFNPGYHDLIITNDHIEVIKDISKDHIENLITTLFNRAKDLSIDKDVTNVNMGINFGTEKEKYPSGASQPHLHAQIGAIFKNGFLPLFSMRRIIEEHFSEQDIDYTGEYIKAIKSSKLAIKESDNFILFAPFAPRFKDEVHILPKDINIPNLISIKPSQITELVSMLYNVINTFKGENGSKLYIPSFNITFEGDEFKASNKTRMMVSIIPRQSEIAYSELNSRFVIDRFPEDTASYIKEWI